MADSVQERVGKLEQKTHTIEYQLTELRQLPPRVSELERAFPVMSANLTDIKADHAWIKSELVQIKTSQDRMSGALEALPRYIKITLAVITVASLAGVVSLWAQ